VLLRKAETEEDRDLVIEALKFSGLYDDVKNLEEGIDTLVTREFHRKGQIFSGGQIQKLAIARGYAQNYEVLILDEPSSSLDPLAETALYENMLKLGRNRTLVFISHRLSSTVNCDRIYLLSDGKIAEAGSHEELMANNGLYRRMFEAQTEKYLGDEDV
jgi:ATP-binding cassette subfamily B protein